MRIAVPVWEGRVSPVLDTAGKLVVFGVADGAIVTRKELSLEGKSLPERAREITSNADVLICAALSRPFESYLLSSGINIQAWVMGDAEKLVEMFVCGKTPGKEFFMPGCRRNRSAGCRYRRRRGRFPGYIEN